jgi:hypothetical protein
MDAVNLIETALTQGALAGLKNASSSAVTGAFGTLKSLVSKRLGGRHDMEIAELERAPEGTNWALIIGALLKSEHADHDPYLVAAAASLLQLTDPEGYHAGNYKVDIEQAYAVQFGDHNIQYNIVQPTRSGTFIRITDSTGMTIKDNKGRGFQNGIEGIRIKDTYIERNDIS